jgi:ABC transporter DrrB family efflux protein
VTTATATASADGLRWWTSDAYAMLRRQVLHMLRTPQIMVYSVFQPIMYLLLFVLVFGGAISAPGGDYVQFVVPGVFAQAVLINSVGGATVNFADDMGKGIIDRFRSLPMTRSSVLAGGVGAEVVRNILTLIILVLGGLACGYSFHGSFGGVLAGFGLLLWFGLAFAWLAALIGLATGSPQAAQAVGFIWLPFVFVSSAFVPATSMPGWLQVYAAHSPVTVTVDTVRALFAGTPVGSAGWQALAWCIGIMVVFVPWAVAKYSSTR